MLTGIRAQEPGTIVTFRQTAPAGVTCWQIGRAARTVCRALRPGAPDGVDYAEVDGVALAGLSEGPEAGLAQWDVAMRWSTGVHQSLSVDAGPVEAALAAAIAAIGDCADGDGAVDPV